MNRNKDAGVLIDTDGACSGNQFQRNAGGWGAVMRTNSQVREICGGERNTTNQRMEIMACIRALEAWGRPEVRLELRSDSAYLVNCMNQKWYQRWRRNGWLNAKRRPVENRDLWERLLELVESLDISFVKVKGHSGDRWNERADALARQGMAKFCE
ncbi:MAG TPA: ribonuclease HI [Candidatus Aminicenantes bacterium]|nr:ribonuclease HI [Candidatus Aminicenantes bacterium]